MTKEEKVGAEELIATYFHEDTPVEMPVSLQSYYDTEYAVAMANPQQWFADNREKMVDAMKRPMVRLWLRRCPDKELVRDLKNGKLEEIVSTGALVVGISEEAKAKWKKRLERAIRFLKIVAIAVPPPYSFAVMTISVLFALIIENRLQPI